jgi:hypothetical protein
MNAPGKNQAQRCHSGFKRSEGFSLQRAAWACPIASLRTTLHYFAVILNGSLATGPACSSKDFKQFQSISKKFKDNFRTLVLHRSNTPFFP